MNLRHDPARLSSLLENRSFLEVPQLVRYDTAMRADRNRSRITTLAIRPNRYNFGISTFIQTTSRIYASGSLKSFISAFMQASQIVFQTHQQAKLDALRSAVVNMASPLFANDNIYFMFISWIQIFVPWHLRILKYMESEQISAKHGGTGEVTGPLAMRIKLFPAQEYDFELSKQCFEDLRTRGLINVDTLTHEIEGEMVATAKITNFGKKLLEFITD